MQPHTNGSSSADLKSMRVYVCTRTFAAWLLQLRDLGNIGSDACRAAAGAPIKRFLKSVPKMDRLNVATFVILDVDDRRYQYQYKY